MRRREDDIRLDLAGAAVLTAMLALAPGRPASACQTTCAVPTGMLPTPATDCQLAAESLVCGDTRAWTIPLYQGQQYTFTLCGATCPGAFAAFDAALELRDPLGVLVATSTSACGDDGQIVYSTDPVQGAGPYCILVRRENGMGDFVMGYRVTCGPPGSLTLSPPVAGIRSEDCSDVYRFVLTTAGTPSYSIDWTIVPPPGGSATPPSGTLPASTNAVQFVSRLSGDGRYRVDIDVANACGTEVESFDVDILDRRAPDLGLGAAAGDCAGGILPLLHPEGRDGSRYRRPGSTSPEGGGDLGREAFDAGPRLEAMTPAQPAAAIRSAAGGPMSLPPADPGLRSLLKSRDFPGDVDDRRLEDAPDLPVEAEAAAVSCASPCTGIGDLEAAQPYYAVYVDCWDGSFAAATGWNHPVTMASGARQNVVYGGVTRNAGTSDVGFYVHETGTFYQDRTGAASCLFNPPDTPVEPNSLGLETEWTVSPAPGVQLTLREEVVAFGTSAGDSGIRLTLGASSSTASTSSVTLGVRWLIDYQNATDDGPLFATVGCDPLGVVDPWSTEHDFADYEILDFYRIRNNTGAPVFSNFTSTNPMSGFPGTGRPDRLVFGDWWTMRGSPWGYAATEGSTAPDADSAVLYSYGHLPRNGAVLAPGGTFSRSVVIFTSAADVDCGPFVPGTIVEAEVEACPGGCLRLFADATDGCGMASAVVVDRSPGAPPCTGNPCDLELPPVEGTHVYTWEATDEANNVTTGVATVRVVDSQACCAAEVVTTPADARTCEGGTAVLDATGLDLASCFGTVLYEWRDASGPVGTGRILPVMPAMTTDYTVRVSCSVDPSCFYEDTVRVAVALRPIPGAVTVTDPDPCAAGLQVSWEPATFRNAGATGVYNVYRGADCVDARSRPPLVVGLTVLTWSDPAPPAVAVHVVEAEDGTTGEPCLPPGPHHGGVAAMSCSAPASDVTVGPGCCEARVIGPPIDQAACAGESVRLDAAGLFELTSCTPFGGAIEFEWRDAGGVVGTAPQLVVMAADTADYTVAAWCSLEPTCRIEQPARVAVEHPPTLGPVEVLDPSNCNAGLRVAWPAAVFGDGSSGVYNVYRSDVDCADALARGPVAAGLTGLEWFDSGPLAGVDWIYLVEAEDIRGGSRCQPLGPVGGGAAARSCSLPTVDDQSRVGILPDGVYTTLFVSHVADEVTAHWGSARSLDRLFGEHYALLKAAMTPTSSYSRVNGPDDQGRRWKESDVTSRLQFFDLRVADECEQLSLDEYPATVP